VSFGRRLALFFILIVLIPTLALVGMLLIVNEDSRRGKADARLAAGLDTALALYEGAVAEARDAAQALAADPGLAAGLEPPDPAELQAFARDAVSDGDAEAVEVLGDGGKLLAAAGPENSIAFADTRLLAAGEPAGALRVSTTSAAEYGDEVRRLTKLQLVVERAGQSLTETVVPPNVGIEPGQTVDLELDEGQFRAHLLQLDAGEGEELLLLGPRKQGGFLGLGAPAAALLAGFLLLGIIFAYVLARTLTGLHERVAEQAVTDSLTGLWNRRRMRLMLVREVDRAKRFGHPLSLLIVDVDDFKEINDEYGHPQGDAVLEEIADVVRRTIRSIDVAARYGGDELALILVETDAEGAGSVAARLRERVAELKIPLRDGGTMAALISVGIATVPDSAVEVDDLVQAADQALLEAKRGGKNRVRAAGR
jgi:diguanylate cyclase (GGDEF)-like protein